MIRRFFSPLRTVALAALLCLSLTPAPLLGQPAAPVPSGDERPAGEVDFRTANREAIEKLRKLPPEKVAELDEKLAEALTLYYDGKFAQALPIFDRIAADVETMDIMWWFGTSAMKTGENRLAVEKFRQMLAVDPKLHRVRLEMAVALFQLKRYDEARREALLVQEARPPAAVQKNIDRLLAAIAESTRTLYWNARFSQGLMWDSNVSSGPDQQTLNVTGGTLTLARDSQSISDWASATQFSGNILYDFGQKQGFLWNTTVDLYNQFYFDNGKFNYALADLSTGLWWVGPNDVIKLPLGVAKQEFGSDPLSTVYHIRPSWEHYFTPSLSVRALYGYSKERFMTTANEDQNNVTRRYEVTPSLYLLNRRHIVSLSLGREDASADARRFSYTAPYAAVSYYTRLAMATELFFRYQYSTRDYKAAPLLYSEDRVDRRHGFTAVVSQPFMEHFFGSLAFNAIDNRSNLELYTFRKQTYTLSVGFHF